MTWLLIILFIGCVIDGYHGINVIFSQLHALRLIDLRDADDAHKLEEIVVLVFDELEIQCFDLLLLFEEVHEDAFVDDHKFGVYLTDSRAFADAIHLRHMVIRYAIQVHTALKRPQV